MGIFSNFIRKRRLRKAQDEALDNGHPQAVHDHLQQCPEDGPLIVAAAGSRCDLEYFWHALILCVGLARAKETEALSILERLLDATEDPVLSGRSPVPWDRLEPEHVKALYAMIRACKSGKSGKTMARWMGRLNDEQVSALFEGKEPIAPELLHHLDGYLQTHAPGPELVERLLTGLPMPDDVGDPEALTPADRAAVTACITGATCLWKAGHLDPAVELLALLALSLPAAPPPALVVAVAQRLGDLGGLTRIRATRLLAQCPDSAWLPVLKRQWIGLMHRLRQEHQQREEMQASVRHMVLDPMTARLVNATAVALAAAAAADPGYTDLEDSRTRSGELERLIQQRNGLVDEHNKLVERYKSLPNGGAQIQKLKIEHRIVELRELMTELSRQRQSLEEAHQATFSPATLLILALQDLQDCPADVRQAAAWGLHVLARDGYLSETAEARVERAVAAALGRENREELKAAVTACFPDDPGRAETASDALDTFIVDGNFPKLRDVLQDLGLDLKQTEDLVAEVRMQTGREVAADFRERVVRMLPHERPQERAAVLAEGLRWTRDLRVLDADDADAEGDVDAGGLPGHADLAWSLSLAAETMPGALDFLETYPLRLMPPEESRRLFGQYIRDGGGISQWTRYTSPRWHRGAKPEEIGEVSERYLWLDDRTAPNAMGISPAVFRHPLLALPVIYHEYLHYGGPDGNPAHGIENETETLLREIIFARGLLARLAPARDEDIPAFEAGLLHHMEQAGMQVLGWQLQLDLASDATLEAVNEATVGHYGTQLSPAEAQVHSGRLVDRTNRWIELENRTDEMKLNWCPDIEWPCLGEEKTYHLTQAYRKMLESRAIIDHRLAVEQRDRILAEPASLKWLQAWDQYTQREGALVVFQEASAAQDLALEEVVRTVVRRCLDVDALHDPMGGSIDAEALVKLFSTPSALAEFCATAADADGSAESAPEKL